MTSRHLDWEGCFNARDLGGLRAAEGRTTQMGRIVRADALDGLTPAGWVAATLAELDLEACLLEGGLERDDVAALRRRLLDP